MQRMHCFGYYTNECPNILRKNRGMNVSVSDKQSDQEHDSEEKGKPYLLVCTMEEKHWLQFNPLVVATSVGTPSRNVSPDSSSSICFNMTTIVDTKTQNPKKQMKKKSPWKADINYMISCMLIGSK